MPGFASGRHAIAICDVCGLQCAYRDLTNQIREGKPTGMRVCPECVDQDWRSNVRVVLADPQALWRPRPDTGAKA